jgi:hypothetical protein
MMHGTMNIKCPNRFNLPASTTFNIFGKFVSSGINLDLHIPLPFLAHRSFSIYSCQRSGIVFFVRVQHSLPKVSTDLTIRTADSV